MSLTLSHDRKQIKHYLEKLLSNNFIFENKCCIPQGFLERSFDRIEYSFERINKKYYQDNNIPNFNLQNSDHLAAFFYFLSRESYENSRQELAEQFFILNKNFNSLDLFYEVKLPDVFLFVHPVGSVIGAAEFQDYLCIYQNVTIGANLDNQYPIFRGENILFSGSSVLGNSDVGKNSILGSKAFIIDTVVQSNSICIGSYPNHNIIQSKINVAKDYF